ncbi:MAG: hypothetical protein AB7O91_04135 [Sphingomonas sp.]
MSDFEWPEDMPPAVQSFWLQPHTVRSESPFTRQAKIYALSAPRWVTRMTFIAGADGTAGAEGFGPRLDALIATLEGGANRIAIWDFRRAAPDAELVNAAIEAGDQSARLLGAASGDLRVGQYIGGDGRPHLVTAIAVDGSDLVASVKPAFGAAIAEGAATYAKVAAWFRLVSDDAGENETDDRRVTNYQLDLVEDLAAPGEINFTDEPLTYSG